MTIKPSVWNAKKRDEQLLDYEETSKNMIDQCNIDVELK
jgi:hypothetical protein